MIHHIMTMTPGVINRTRCSDGAVAVAMAVVAATESTNFPCFVYVLQFSRPVK
jgi:hypothetical protein